MFDERKRAIFEKLDMEYPAIAIKFCRNIPKGYKQTEDKMNLCLFVKKCQVDQEPFYISIENEICMGKVILGMEGLDSEFGAVHCCGYMGQQLLAFKTPAPNVRLYHEAPRLKDKVFNYVVFCPVSKCTFDPDLIFCVAETPKAALILRASSYRSGDVWESRCSFVMSCAWSFAYPYVTGKINHLFTGMHLGLQSKGAYPAGLHILSIPYNRIDEVIDSLYEMEWYPFALDKSPEGIAANDAMEAHCAEVAADIHVPIEI